jgi:AraC-like DNA-binding protein
MAMWRFESRASFLEFVGETPPAYLTRWRMFIAVKLFRDRQRPLVDIAAAVGYESSAAFSKAFQTQYGTPPGRFRAASGIEARPFYAPVTASHVAGASVARKGATNAASDALQ